jgi:hypothetical protein
MGTAAWCDLQVRPPGVLVAVLMQILVLNSLGQTLGPADPKVFFAALLAEGSLRKDPIERTFVGDVRASHP